MTQPYIFFHRFGTVIRRSDNKIVAPAQSVDDPDFKEYNNWAMAGNHPDDDLTVPMENCVPVTVKADAFRFALNALGHRHEIEAGIAASTNQYLKDKWEYSEQFNSEDYLFAEFFTSVGVNYHEVFLMAETY